MFKRWLSIDEKKSALIIGPRRSGKTTYLKQRFPNLLYVTLDDLDALEFARRDAKGFISSLGDRAVIDEIQRAPELSIAIKYAIDNEDAVFYMTGSSSIGLLDANADSLAGRVNIYHFPTMIWGESVSEFREDLFGDERTLPEIRDAYRRLDDVMGFGLFPEVVSQVTKEDKLSVLKNYKNTYFTRDLMQLANIENLEGILGVYAHLGQSIGSQLDVSHFAAESGLSFPSAKKYLNALLQSDLGFKVYGYQFGPAKRYIKAAKYYFADNGVLTSFNAALSDGQRLEHFVVSELEKRRKLGMIDSEGLFYYKTTSGREIDVVYELPDRVIAIEIKSTRQPRQRDLTTLKEFSKLPIRGKSVVPIFFYLGEDYLQIDTVRVIPIAALFGGV